MTNPTLTGALRPMAICGSVHARSQALDNSPGKRKRALDALPAGTDGLTARTGVLASSTLAEQHVDSRSFRGDIDNTGAASDPNLQLAGFGLANLSAGVESRDGRWRVLAWVENADDTAYSMTRSHVVRARHVGDPRTDGLSLTGRF